MFEFILWIMVCAFIWRLNDYFQNRKIKKMEKIRIEKEIDQRIIFKDMEKEMREKGIDESAINMARFFFTD